MHCDSGRCGNWPGQRQDPWKYIAASFPHRKFNQVLQPEITALANLGGRGSRLM
jgi:hypothetical protein